MDRSRRQLSRPVHRVPRRRGGTRIAKGKEDKGDADANKCLILVSFLCRPFNFSRGAIILLN